MSERGIAVYVDVQGKTELVGNAFFHGHGKGLRTTFTYTPGWVASPRSFALSPQAPLQNITTRSMSLLGFLSDAAPDRWGRHLIFRGMQNEAARSQSPLRGIDDVDYLLGVDDWSRMGALRFSPSGGKTFLGVGTDIPKLVSLPKLLDASRSVSAGSDGWEQVKSLLDAGSSSLGGARPKATVADGATLLLAKFPSAHDDWNVIAWEAWALEMARRTHLRVPPWHLEHFGESAILLEERFDRTARGRIPYQSALCALGLSDGMESDYAELGDITRTTCTDASGELLELFGRMALSIALHNTDDHLRNHGFLRIGTGWQLSPLFDVNPNPFAHEQRALYLFGESGNKEVEGLKACGTLFGISEDGQKSCIARIVEAFRYWKPAAKQLGCTAREIALFEPVFEERLHALREAF